MLYHHHVARRHHHVLADKNPDNPNAADEFAALQRAYDILMDAEARAALDALLK
jgi:curved DNA-binding protein CbpA